MTSTGSWPGIDVSDTELERDFEGVDLTFGYRLSLDGGPRGTWRLDCREDLNALTSDSPLVDLSREMLSRLAPDFLEDGDTDVFLFPTDTEAEGTFPIVDVFRVHFDASNRYSFDQERYAQAITDTCAFATCP